MTFRFIHTADWQLGRAFGNLPPELAGELSGARYAAIARIAGIASANGARHVLVAGDIFDAEDLSNTMLRRALERMAEQSAVTWVLLPGNHDPARTGGVWDRVMRFGVPANIICVREDQPLALDGNVFVLPSPLTSKNPGRDPTQWMDTGATPAGAVRIGLAHGSVQGFGSDGESSVLIARDRAATAGLSYLALGDWHGALRVGPQTWYSGTPEPDRFPNNEPGHVLAVSVDGPGVAASVEKIASAQFTWARTTAALRSSSDLAGLEASVASLSTSPGKLLLKLVLTGSLSLSEHADLDAWRETWQARLAHLDVDTAALAVRPVDQDFENLGSDGPLVEAARSLADIASDPTRPDSAVAALALQRLFGFAAQARREGGA
ncbi:MAG: DNA repair exonuclease [Hyphomicrobium sp.]|nr:DNA repair exonuclease [Hyphomicrobium sp.]